MIIRFEDEQASMDSNKNVSNSRFNMTPGFGRKTGPSGGWCGVDLPCIDADKRRSMGLSRRCKDD